MIVELDKEKAARAKAKWPLTKLYEMCEYFEYYEIALVRALELDEVDLRRELIKSHHAGTVSKWESYDQPLNTNMLLLTMTSKNVKISEVLNKTPIQIKNGALSRVIEIHGMAEGLAVNSFRGAHGLDIMLAYTVSVMNQRATFSQHGQTQFRHAIYSDIRDLCPNAPKQGLEELEGFVNTWQVHYGTCVSGLKHLFPRHILAFEQFIK